MKEVDYYGLQNQERHRNNLYYGGCPAQSRGIRGAGMLRHRRHVLKRAKDGIVEWLGRENLSKGVQIRSVGDMLDVDLFIIVEYGISIAEVCKTIVDTVRYKLESMTGVKVRKVNISVEGIRV